MLAFAALRLPVAPPVAAIIAAVAVTTAARSMVVLRMVSNLSQEGDSETLWALPWTVPRRPRQGRSLVSFFQPPRPCPARPRRRGTGHPAGSVPAGRPVVSAGLGTAPLPRGQKSSSKLTVAADADLVGRDPALEEVRQLLHVLQLHERERVLRRRRSAAKPSWASRWSATYSRYSRMSADRQPGHAAAEQVLGELASRTRPPRQHRRATCCCELVVEQVGLLARGRCRRPRTRTPCASLSSRNTQLVPDARPWSRPRERRK